MDPWEQLAVRTLDSVAQLGLNFGQAYGQNWLAQSNAEAQLDLARQYRAAFPAPAGPHPLMLALIVGLVVFAVAKD